jgi:DNA-directed RNA polymerase III subunit RPC6
MPPSIKSTAGTPKRATSSPARGSAAGAKRARTIRAGAASRAVKADPEAAADAPSPAVAAAAAAGASLEAEFIAMFSAPEAAAAGGGVTNTSLKARFGDARLPQLATVINALTTKGRLTMSRHATTSELVYSLISEDQASKFEGLDTSARLVYQIIEKSGNMGIWTKDIRTQSNIQQLALNKIFKSLEGRRLIKPTKSVTAKAKKLYMLYDLQPAKELTGGPWYTELEFDHEFIAELRHFILHCVKRLNGGKGVSLQTIMDKMKEANVSKVNLSLEEIRQLVQTLVYDYMVETTAGSGGEDGAGAGAGEELYIAARRVSSMCDFKWWDVLSDDFQYRQVKFEDGVTLAAHEPHHHTA